MKKKILAALLLLAMLLAMLSVSALADDTTIYASGTCGDNLTWTIDSKWVLTISGTGDMYDYSVEGYTTVSNSPWSKSIQSVVINDGVTSIGNYAFEGCTVIHSVSIPDSVTKIGNNAFAYCQSLTSVTIPDSITEITESAFQCCGNLTSVTIPDNVISIGESAFRHCEKLPGITIPDSVKSIGAYAFYDDCALISVTIPEGVESIGESAFENCWEMTSVTIPDSVTSIGDAAFKSCSALISVVIPDSITSIPENAFYACSDLTSVTIPDSVKSIGASAFCACHSLTSVTIPDGVTVINDKTFASCFSLSSVTIPDSLTDIGEEAFYDCEALLTIRIPDNITSLGTGAFSYCRNLTSAIIGNGITSVSESAFCGCSSLTSVTIPASVTSICSGAFSGCDSLTDVYISDLSAWCAIDFVYGSNPLNYASNLYLNGELVTDLVIPGNTPINRFAFESCECLKSLTILSAFIDVNAFAECSNLTSVSLGYVSGLWDFSDSTKIEKITFTDCAPNVTTSSYFDENGNEVARGPFYGITANAYYPANDNSWTAEVMAQIGAGANLTWIPYTTHKHTWDAGEVTTASTCAAAGVMTFTCTSCGQTKTEVIPALAHTWNDGKVTTWPTATTDGVRTYTCSVCSTTKTEVIPARESPFDDVQNTSRYYYEPVLWAANKEITTGYSDGTFQPNTNCSRANIVTFLWRAYGCPEPETTENPFTDVAEGRYYYKAVLWAVENGITNGFEDGTFRPNDYCNRGQAVTFIWRAAGMPEPTTTENPFTDVAEGRYYYKAVLWAVENGITTGYSDGTFQPNTNCSRANIVTFLYRADQNGLLNSGK